MGLTYMLNKHKALTAAVHCKLGRESTMNIVRPLKSSEWLTKYSKVEVLIMTELIFLQCQVQRFCADIDPLDLMLLVILVV